MDLSFSETSDETTDYDDEGTVKGVSSLAMSLLTFDTKSPADKRSAIIRLETNAREQLWGEILDKSFNSHSVIRSNGHLQSSATPENMV